MKAHWRNDSVQLSSPWILYLSLEYAHHVQSIYRKGLGRGKRKSFNGWYVNVRMCVCLCMCTRICLLYEHWAAVVRGREGSLIDHDGADLRR